MAEEDWFDRYQAARDHEVRLGIVLEDSSELIGAVYLTQIDWVNRSAYFGLLIGEREHWGQGYGTEATRLAVEHAFFDLNLRRITLHVLEDHDRAIGVYERVGFEREGVLREAVYKDGKYRSLVVMGLVRDGQETAEKMLVTVGAREGGGT
jgi:RimJ/RimL family protein N-acetyltransferase